MRMTSLRPGSFKPADSRKSARSATGSYMISASIFAQMTTTGALPLSLARARTLAFLATTIC